MNRHAPALLVCLAAGAVLVAPSSGWSQVRIITGPGISPPPTLEGRPQRIEPPKPAAKPPAPIVERRLGPVVVESAAEIRAGRLRIRLPGVEPIDRDETCRDDAGQDWACGRRALPAARQLVRLRPVVCRLPSDARTGSYEATCTVAGEDLGERFVASGWARATAGGPWATAEAEAKAARRGLWGPAPVVVALPDRPPPSEDLPPDRTTAPLTGGGPAPSLGEDPAVRRPATPLPAPTR